MDMDNLVIVFGPSVVQADKVLLEQPKEIEETKEESKGSFLKLKSFASSKDKVGRNPAVKPAFDPSSAMLMAKYASDTNVIIMKAMLEATEQDGVDSILGPEL